MGIFDLLKPKPALSETQAELPKKKVLVVEDEDPIANALVTKLTNSGFEVFRGENGQIGLELLTKHHPDIALIDILMPVMDGKVMLKKLREIPEFKLLPVIILTNFGDIDNIKETQTYYNASDFLIKANTSIDDVVAKVNSSLAKPTA